MRISHRHVVFLLAAAVCFLAGSMLLPGLNRDRKEHHLVMAPLGKGHSPELVLATTVLGGFRSLALNAAAWRAWELKVDGKFWELVQLYDWIATLQPYQPKIWGDIAWNMAYNIVAELDDTADRWQWIWRAIETLRDKGLVYNPESSELAYEIAWTFQQKIGRETDEHYMGYMHFLALMVEGVLGTGLLDLEGIAALPEDLAAFRAAEPKAAELLDRFQAVGIDLVAEYDRVTRVLLEGPPDGRKRLAVEPDDSLLADEKIAAWLAGIAGPEVPPQDKVALARSILRRVSEDLAKQYGSQAYADARYRIKLWRIGQNIRKVFRMDPARMLLVEKQLARLDWRLPEAHALYWAQVAYEERHKAIARGFHKPDTVDAQRLRWFCVQQLFRRGTILYMSRQRIGYMRFGMNLDFLDAADRAAQAYVDYFALHAEERGAEGSGDIQKDFLQEAVRLLNWAGQTTRAREFYNRLNRLYPSDDRDRLTMEEWVAGQIKKMVTEWARQNQVENLIEGMLIQGYLHLVIGQNDLAAAYEEQAHEAWEYYRKDTLERREFNAVENLPTWEELKAMVVQRVLDGQYGEMFPSWAVARLSDLLGVKPAARGSGS